VPEAVAANRTVFVAAAGQHLSPREVHGAVRGILRSERAVHTRPLDRVEDTAERFGLASARRGAESTDRRAAAASRFP